MFLLKKIRKKKIFFVDADGTLILGKKVIDGGNSFLDKLKNKNLFFYILTNNSSKTPNQHLKKLKKLGLNIEINNIVVSIESVIYFLFSKNIKNIFWVANKKVSEFLKNKGFVYDEKNPQALLLTYDNEINYEKIRKLVCLVRKGIPYYATHADLVCPTHMGNIPDIGTFIKLIKMTMGVVPKKVFGKPKKSLVRFILKKHGLSYEDSVIVGDRLYTDIKLAENSDITSVLVLSGETKRSDYEYSKIRSNIVIPKISSLIDYL